MKKVLLHNVSGVTIIAVGAFIMFLATKVDGGRLLLVLIGNALFILGVLALIFHEKLEMNIWRERVDLFSRALVYFALFIFTIMVLIIAVGL